MFIEKPGRFSTREKGTFSKSSNIMAWVLDLHNQLPAMEYPLRTQKTVIVETRYPRKGH